MRSRLMHALCDLEVGNWARGHAPLVTRISLHPFYPGLVLLVNPPRLGCQETARPHPLVAIPPSFAPQVLVRARAPPPVQGAVTCRASVFFHSVVLALAPCGLVLLTLREWVIHP